MKKRTPTGRISSGSVKRGWAAVLFVGIFMGCAAKQVPDPVMPQSVPSQATVPQPALPGREPPVCEGTLWRTGGSFNGLFVDYKARGVGDVITIQVVEDTKASNSADTKTGRQSSVSATLDGFMGLDEQFPRSNGFNPFAGIKGGLESDFSGTGNTQRSGALKAEVSARVIDVLPNGNLLISGSREITVNNEKQYIVISGIVQPRDISADNKITSNRIADARIVYSGIGILDERQQPGWLARALDVVWPF